MKRVDKIEKEILTETANWFPAAKFVFTNKQGMILFENHEGDWWIPFSGDGERRSKAYEVLAPILDTKGTINLDKYRRNDKMTTEELINYLEETALGYKSIKEYEAERHTRRQIYNIVKLVDKINEGQEAERQLWLYKESFCKGEEEEVKEEVEDKVLTIVDVVNVLSAMKSLVHDWKLEVCIDKTIERLKEIERVGGTPKQRVEKVAKMGVFTAWRITHEEE